MSATSHKVCLVLSGALAACGTSNNGAVPANDAGGPTAEASLDGAVGGAKNPDNALVVGVDRFSDAFAHLFKRSANPSFPAANAPIDCDQGPFITHGLGPNGEKVSYYNFDVLQTTPAPICRSPEARTVEWTARATRGRARRRSTGWG